MNQSWLIPIMKPVLLLAVFCISAHAAVTYSVSAVTAPPGAAMFGPGDPSSSGMLTGTAVYNNGGSIGNVGFIPLGFTPTGINEANQLTGQFSLQIYQGYPGTSYFQNYFYNGSGWYGLNDPYVSGATTAVGMDSSGSLVGTVLGADGTTHTLVWSASGSWIDLNSLSAGYLNVTATNVSANGLVTGSADGKAFLYNGTNFTAVATPQGSQSQGNYVTSTGQVAGEFKQSGTEHAFFTDSLGQVLDLGTLGGSNSEALGANSLGQVVGWSQTASGVTHAFLYSGGKMVDLNSLLGTNSDWTIVTAISINDAGSILATAINLNGQVKTVTLAAQVPEPTTGLLSAAGILILVWRHRRRVAKAETNLS